MKIPPQPVPWLNGDKRWTLISPLSSYAPVVVILLLLLCIVQIVMGAWWISKIGGELDFAMVLQPLVLPCLSLFNTVPSLHLHLHTRTNNPLLALWFCGILSLLYFVSAIISLVVCKGNGTSMRAECPAVQPGDKGPDITWSYWNANVALWFLSAFGYLFVACVAVKVWRGFRVLERDGGHPGMFAQGGGSAANGASVDEGHRVVRTRGIGEGKRVRDWEEEMLTEEERAQRLKKAEEKWRKVVDL